MERILLNKTNHTTLMKWLTTLGKYKTEHKDSGKALRTAIITTVREKNDTQKRENRCIVIESIPFSTEIRFPKKQDRKSQMPKTKMTNQDLSFISNNSLPFNRQHKCL